MKIKLFVNKEVRPAAAIIYPEMGLSSGKEKMQKHQFELRISVNEFIKEMNEIYSNWVLKSKKKDNLLNEAPDEITKAGYPKIEEIIKDKELLELAFNTYLSQEVFNNMKKNFFVKVKYWIDWIESCSFDGKDIIYRGICYSKKRKK
jgi:hypothetical protein